MNVTYISDVTFVFKFCRGGKIETTVQILSTKTPPTGHLDDLCIRHHLGLRKFI